jgi:TonB family protein
VLPPGTLPYFPARADAQFRLEVYLQDGRSVAESTRVILPTVGRNDLDAKIEPTSSDIAPGFQAPEHRGQALQPTTWSAVTHQAIDSVGLVVVPSASQALTQADAEAPKSSTATTSHALAGAQIYRPPRSIKQVNPPVSLLTSSDLHKATEVQVQIRINPKGYVIDARATGDRMTGNDSLTQAALAAARHWIFEPATLNGKATAADHIIVFQFHPRID